METIKKILAHDKLKHFFIGTIASLFGLLLFKIGLSDHFIWIPCVIIGLAKDLVWDGLLRKGEFEFLDIAYTVFAGVFLYLFV